MPGQSTDGGGSELLRKRAYLEDFLSYQVDELGRSERTAHSYRYALQALSKFVNKPVEKVTTDDLRRFKRESDYAPATIQGVVVAMHQFHKWGALEGYWKTNGILAVPTPKVDQPVQPPVPIATVRALLAGCRTPLETRVVYLGLYAGCRISESAAMREHHFRFDRLEFKGKGGKTRVVPIHRELAKVRAEIVENPPASPGVLHSSLERIRTRLGAVDGWSRPVRSHALRRTFATSLYEAGTPYEVVGKLLGHGADVTARYARIPFDKMREAMDSLNYFSGEPVQLSLWVE